MKCFIVVALLVASASASAGGYGGGASLAKSAGLGLVRAVGSGNAASMAGQVVPAAIHTLHNIEYRDVPSSGSVTPTMIDVGSQALPLMIMFRSSSSLLDVQHQHNGGGGGVQETSSEDEPHRLIHQVNKPIIQEVREIISPFRKITQEIQPVQEEIQTIVARNTNGAAYNGVNGFSNGAAFSNVGLSNGKSLGDLSLGLGLKTKSVGLGLGGGFNGGAKLAAKSY